MAADTLISMVVRLSVTQRGNFLVVLQSGGSADVEIQDHSILIVNVWGVLIMARFKRGEIQVLSLDIFTISNFPNFDK